MPEFPCTDCPIYIMCKNKIHAQKNPSAFTLCPILNTYLYGHRPDDPDLLLVELETIVDRINEVRDYFGLGPVINKLRGMED